MWHVAEFPAALVEYAYAVQHTLPLAQSAASLQACVAEPVGHVPALSAWHVPPSTVAQHSCDVVEHVVDPHGTAFGSLGTPPSGTPVEPLLLPVPPSPPLLPVPPSVLPLSPDEPLLLLVVPLLEPPPSSPEPPLDDAVPLLVPPPLLDPKPPLLPCPPPSFPGELLLLLPLQCASTTGAPARARTQKAIVV